MGADVVVEEDVEEEALEELELEEEEEELVEVFDGELEGELLVLVGVSVGSAFVGGGVL